MYRFLGGSGVAHFNLLQEKILKDGVIKSGNVLKVDSFLNHQIDVPFISELGKEFYSLFSEKKIDKVLTIESSGIGIACLTAIHFGVPVVFAKKSAAKKVTLSLNVINLPFQKSKMLCILLPVQIIRIIVYSKT